MTQPDKLVATFLRMLDEERVKALRRSYFLAMRDERKGRLEAIMELSVELTEIKKVTMQASAFGEATIEEIIEGDWERAAETVRLMLNFPPSSHDPTYHVRMNQVYEKFRAIFMAAHAEAKRREAGQPSGGN